MRYTILFSIFLLLLAGCNKDKFGTDPTLKLKSVNTKELRSGQLLQITLSFTDKLGGVGDTLYIEKYVPYCAGSSFSQLNTIGSFPATTNQKGDLIVTFGYNADPYQNISPQCQQNDTAIFRFVLKDPLKHASDTVTTPPIIIYY
jgi:hypothetical protein